jgi:hypothetical protein
VGIYFWNEASACDSYNKGMSQRCYMVHGHKKGTSQRCFMLHAHNKGTSQRCYMLQLIIKGRHKDAIYGTRSQYFNETSACDMSVPYNIFVTSLYYVRVPYNIFVTPLYCDRVPYNICVAPFLYCDRVYHIASLWRPFIVTCIPNSINLCDVTLLWPCTIYIIFVTSLYCHRVHITSLWRSFIIRVYHIRGGSRISS